MRFRSDERIVYVDGHEVQVFPVTIKSKGAGTRISQEPPIIGII